MSKRGYGFFRLYCVLGLHRYRVEDTGILTDRGVQTGRWFVQRCQCCGKLKMTALRP